MNSFAPSFYHMDKVVVESTEPAAVQHMEEEDDTVMVIESAALPKVPVFSMYFQPGMAAPAYNMLQKTVQKEQIPVDNFLLKTVQKKEETLVEETVQKEPVEQIPVDYFMSKPVVEETKQYKESHYLGFKSDVQPAYRSQQKHVAFAAIPEQIPTSGSRLVKSVQVAELAEPQPDTEYSSIEGDAFRPIMMPHSEYQFDKLNDLVSYVKQ